MLIDSERMKFRKYNDYDFEFLFSLMYDPIMVQYISVGKTRSREETQDFLKWIYSTYNSDPDTGLLVLVDKQNGNLIGHAGLISQTIDGTEEIEIGCWISRKYWGNGYATEAGNALRNYGVDVLNNNRFIALIHPENAASKRVAEKLGMNLEKEVIISGQNIHMYSTLE